MHNLKNRVKQLMKKNGYSLLAIVAFSCVASCTLEKRLYNKGWHMESKSRLQQNWNATPKVEVKRDCGELTDFSDSLSMEPSIRQVRTITEATNDEWMTIIPEIDSSTIEKTAFKPVKFEEDQPAPSIEPFGLASFVSAATGTLAIGLSFIPVLSFLQTFVFFLAILALILAIVSLIRWRRKPSGTYKMKWMTWFGFLFGITGFLYIVAIVLFVLKNYK